MGEKLIGKIYGIVKSVKVGRPATTIGGFQVGTFADTENTLLVTDRRLLFISVPVGGEGLNLGGVDVSTMQSFFNRKSIEKKGDEMLKRMSLQEILESNKANFELPFGYIKEIKFGWFGSVKIVDVEGKKYRYSMKSGQRKSFKELLSIVLPNKIV